MTDVATGPRTDLDLLCINTVRTLAMDAVQQADSGHPGTPMALAPLAYVLWTRHLKYDPATPDWPDRDRFVLSCGHASMLLYAALYLSGYDLTLDDIKKFRQWGSKTPGHPEYGHTAGVETTTGPLGQGTGNAVGMAIAEAILASGFNQPGHDVVNHFTYFLASDGDLMEGISHEACSLAGHLKLGKLIGFYDDNHITIEGDTNLAFSEDTARRFESYGWHVQRVADGNDLAALDQAIAAAKKAVDHPSLIIVRTHIGYGAPTKQDTAEAHGAALGVEEIKGAKQNLGWPSQEPFYVPAEALDRWRKAGARGRETRNAWQARFAAYQKASPELGAELERRLSGKLPAAWEQALPNLSADAAQATRAASGKVLNAIASRLPELVGGSADLAGSNNTLIKGTGDFAAGHYTERNFHFGVREHGMGAVMNGLALHRGLIPYGGTFLIFSDYMRPAIRLAALCKLGTIYVFTHDSIGLGEDGPTHQPIEQLATLRTIPGLLVIRPADAAEVVEAWRVAINHRNGPVALALTRQKVAALDRKTFGAANGLARGGYVLAEATGAPKVILIATGSEVELAVSAREKLQASGVPTRVVSMPSLELFAAQSQEYRNQVLPPAVSARVSIEAGATQCWHAIVGDRGRALGLDHFGASAPYQKLYQEFGLTVEKIVAAAKQVSA
ncbi:MAG TPA: transketolase [Gemmatimonadales bacterium]|nr:transketolase [Gemmatimonadales bacterium]